MKADIFATREGKAQLLSKLIRVKRNGLVWLSCNDVLEAAAMQTIADLIRITDWLQIHFVVELPGLCLGGYTEPLDKVFGPLHPKIISLIGSLSSAVDPDNWTTLVGTWPTALEVSMPKLTNKFDCCNL